MTNFKKKPASQIGAPISRQEYQQLTTDFQKRFPSQVPSVFISRELILRSIEGLSNVSGIEFVYGLNDSNDAASRSIILVPTYDRSNGQSGIVKVISGNGYFSSTGERIGFEKLLMLLGNHVTNFKGIEPGIVRSRIPRGYMWGINKLLKLLEVEGSAGLVLHFGFNTKETTGCRQHQNVLEVVDSNQKSLDVFMEWGQCTPPCTCPPDDPECHEFWVATYVGHADQDAESKMVELSTFRDTWLLNQPDGQSLYELYYFVSQSIVIEMKDHPDEEVIRQEVYDKIFSTWLNLIREKRFEEAKAYYIDLMYDLAGKFLVQETVTRSFA